MWIEWYMSRIQGCSFRAAKQLHNIIYILYQVVSLRHDML